MTDAQPSTFFQTRTGVSLAIIVSENRVQLDPQGWTLQAGWVQIPTKKSLRLASGYFTLFS